MAYQNNNRGGGGNKTKLQVTTQIRTLYSPEMSYMTIKFYNNYLSIQMVPFSGKNASGADQYNWQKGIMTTINYEDAFTLYSMGRMIAEDTIQGDSMRIVISGRDSMITLDWSRNAGGAMMVITKGNDSVQFKFAVKEVDMMVNGQPTKKMIESGLGSFAKVMEGYLTGINADRHLNKLTDEYAKSQEAAGGGQGSWQGNKGGYQKRGGYNQGSGSQPQAPSTPAPWDPAKASPVTNFDNYNLPQ